MRLVDIDEFENNTVSKFERNNNFEYRDMVKSIIFSIVQDLDKQPRMLFLHDAIEIVKKGGIEWKLKKW